MSEEPIDPYPEKFIPPAASDKPESATVDEIAQECVDKLGKKAVTDDGWWPNDANPIVRSAIRKAIIAAIPPLQAELEQANAEKHDLLDDLENVEVESDETWIDALAGLGLKPIMYDLGETREETINCIVGLYGQQIEDLQSRLATAEADTKRLELLQALSEQDGDDPELFHLNFDWSLREWNSFRAAIDAARAKENRD